MSVSWFDGITITVEAALSAATGTYGAWNSAVWDGSTWGPDTLWVDISAYVRNIQTRRQFGRFLQEWQAGTAQVVLDNRDARFSPSNLSGPYVTSGVTQIRPWRPFRIKIAYAGTTYSLFTGYAVSWQQNWPGPVGANKGDSFVRVLCEDELSRLARFDGLAQTPAGAGELSGARIHRILNAAAHIGNRNIDMGSNTMQATDLSANTVTELLLTTASEGGALYIDDDGTVRFDEQLALVNKTRSNTVQATFGDGGGAELPYSDIKPDEDDGRLIKNIASFTRVGGTVQTRDDLSSRAIYQDLRETRNDFICTTDTQVDQLAAWFVNQYKDPEVRIAGITIKPRGNPASLYPQALGRKVRDLVRVIRRSPGSHTVTRDCHIAGISHNIDHRNASWLTTFDLWSATVYQTVGRWDSAIWDTSTFFI